MLMSTMTAEEEESVQKELAELQAEALPVRCSRRKASASKLKMGYLLISQAVPAEYERVELPAVPETEPVLTPKLRKRLVPALGRRKPLTDGRSVARSLRRRSGARKDTFVQGCLGGIDSEVHTWIFISNILSCFPSIYYVSAVYILT